MRKILVVVLLTALMLPLFADDAWMLPTGVLRITEANLFGLVPGYYDKDGAFTAYKEKEGFVKAFNLGLAFELGVTDWITAAIQWGPGATVWSTIDNPAPGDKANVNGLYDVFIGAKIQIVGEKAPVQQKTMRFAVAPGIKIPLPGPDWKTQKENYIKVLGGNSTEFTAKDADKHAIGLGGRLFFDYVINEMFFINLYNETIFFLPVEKGSLATGDTTKKYEYGYDTTFELEPRFIMPLGSGVRFYAGLPVNLKMTPRTKYNDSEQKDSTMVLGLGPKLNIFLTSLPLPLEIELGYSMPVYAKADVDGTGTLAKAAPSHAIKLLLRPYLKLF